MRPGALPTTLGLLVVAVLLQTTLFGEGKIQPFGASPALVTIVVLAVARHLEPEPAVLAAFTGGLLMDLLGASPIGLWAISITTVGYLTVRLRRLEDRGLLLVAVGVFGLVFLGNALFSIVGTVFGQRTLTDSDVIDLMVLPGLYSLILAAAIFPGVTRLLVQSREAAWQQ